MSLSELRKALKDEKIIFGTKSTLKKIRDGKVKKVFLASNCPKNTEENIKHYAKLAKADVVKLKIPNDELGVTCKKQYLVSILCY